MTEIWGAELIIQLDIRPNLVGEVSTEDKYDLDSSPDSPEDFIQLSYEFLIHFRAYIINVNKFINTITHNWIIDSGFINYIFFDKKEFTNY